MSSNRLSSVLRGLACALALLWVMGGCAHKPDPEPTWGYGPKGVKITYKAVKLLNAYEDKPHALLMVVYQLSESNQFKKLSQYEDGLRQLLEAKGTDPTFMAVRKVYVEPGQTKTLVLDRAEKARWVGVVAGYYALEPGKVTALFEIPHTVETKGLIRRKRVAEVRPLEVTLILGEQAVQEQTTP